ncbi:leucine zipper putative tumor suppressor 2 homolog isoform X2 [Watersipora subatra]|uniref:leucine zipper putative tumor suppressor 2 homolog isoform X2 n=1 Tax=Watersipora subatra TaxID=2589382 RepID=UPI00355BA47A
MDYSKILGIGYYPTRSEVQAITNMRSNRRRSQPDILESADSNGFYSSNYLANYTHVYSPDTASSSLDSQDSQQLAKDYSLVPRMGRRAAQDHNGKYYKRENSLSEEKKDYQDVYKNKKSAANSTTQKENLRHISVDTGAVVSAVPSVPSRRYRKEEDYATYEELAEEPAPPQIAPVSGLLNQSAGKAVVRPIAFKPVASSKMSSSLTYSTHSQDYSFDKPHVDDGYSSQESRACSHNGTMRDNYICESSQYRDIKSHDCYQVTPSPTDNIAHYEQIIQEKDVELSTLRETMEENEHIIFKVNEEKRQNWESQMKELTSEYHRRLRLQQERARKCEQELQDQINRLQRENTKMIKEREQYSLHKEHNSAMIEQLKTLRYKNDELSSRLAGISCDCELLRQQDEEKHKQIQTLEELVTVIKAENMNLTNELDEKHRLVRKLERQQDKQTPPDDRESTRLKALLAEKDSALKSEREQFLQERDSWEQEKKKVLQYQRQLQSNYIQMCRRNSDLEANLPIFSRPNLGDRQTPNIKPQETCNFKAQLECTPESLC